MDLTDASEITADLKSLAALGNYDTLNQIRLLVFYSLLVPSHTFWENPVNMNVAIPEMPLEPLGLEFMRCVLESSSDCIQILDLDGRIRFISQSGVRLMEAGGSADVLGRSFKDLFVGEGRLRAEDALNMAREGEVSRFHGFSPTLKGSPRWWGVIIIPVGKHQSTGRQLLALSSDITERVNAEERYRLASLAMNEGIYDFDIVSDRIEWSESARVMFGYVSQISTPSAWWEERIHPEDRKRVKAGFTKALDGLGTEWSEEYRFLRSNGEYAYVLERAFIVRNHFGVAVRMVGAMLDQTERKKTANQIQSLVRTLSNVLESTTDSVMMLDRMGRITYLNRRAEEQLAKGRNLIGQRILDVEPEMVRSDFKRAVIRTFKNDVPSEAKQYYAPLRQWIEARTYPAEGGVTIFFRDVTDKVLAEEALRESRARLKLAQEAGQIGTWEWDLATGAQVWSDSMYTLFGWDPKGPPVTHQKFLDAIHPADRREMLARAHSLILGERPYDTQFRIVRPDGEVRWLATRGEVVHCENGTPLRMYGVNYDVTEARRISDQLAEAKRAAEQANQAKTEFLASMSHEIRTPLHGIIASTDLLLEHEDLSVSQRRHAQRIATAGKALLTIVNDILDFSKIEAGQVDLNIRPFSVHCLVEEAVSIVRCLLDQKKLAFSLTMDREVPSLVLGDPDRLRQVLLNLLNNAIKFTPRGCIELRVNAEAITGTGWSVLFSVRDTGIGIPREKQDRLFKSFSQVDSSDRRQYGGTGLGLAISKRLIEVMGGEIGVQSEAGQGSTFWFRVELAAADRSGAVQGSVRGAEPARPARVLLVEDSEILQDLTRTMLENGGYTVDVAENGAAGIAALQAGSYDVILMDVQMPVMDGLSATKHIRVLPGAEKEIPIIGLTANTLPYELVAVRDAGMNDHICKPFRRDELFAMIDKWVFSTASTVG